MDDIRRAFNILVAATALLFLVTVLLILWVWHDSGVKRDKIQKGRFDARFALCTEDNKVKTVERKNLEKQIARSRDFLQTHPQGTKDFPRGLFLEGIQDMIDAHDSLALGDCETFARNPTLEVPTKKERR